MLPIYHQLVEWGYNQQSSIQAHNETNTGPNGQAYLHPVRDLNRSPVILFDQQISKPSPIEPFLTDIVGNKMSVLCKMSQLYNGFVVEVSKLLVKQSYGVYIRIFVTVIQQFYSKLTKLPK